MSYRSKFLLKVALNKRIFTGGCAFGISPLSSGCNVESNSKESTNIAAFLQIVELDLPARSVRWEMLSTPEYSMGVPGPTDFVTLPLIKERSKKGRIKVLCGYRLERRDLGSQLKVDQF